MPKILHYLFILSLFLLGTSLLRAQPFNDPDKAGGYAVGHVNYSFVDPARNGRPIFTSVFYPVNPRDLSPSAPPATYATDPFYHGYPDMDSNDFVAVGCDPAYEGPRASGEGPFPLILFSHGSFDSNWSYNFLAIRVASHGYVVAVNEHYGDGQWPWSAWDDWTPGMVDRPLDISFTLTELLAMNHEHGSQLFRTIDPERVAASGHSYGGYAAYALAAGDQMVNDTLWFIVAGWDTLPYPTYGNVKLLPDPRIKALVVMEGVSAWLHFDELAKISVPSLILGETIDQLNQFAVIDEDPPDLFTTWNARAHAAITRAPSLRVEIGGANHASFRMTDSMGQLFYNLGWITQDDLNAYLTNWPCATTGPDAQLLPETQAHAVIQKYVISFLDQVFKPQDPFNWLEKWVLTPEYALCHTPLCQVYEKEACCAEKPDDTWYTYRPTQVSSHCDIEQKDPTGWFVSTSETAQTEVGQPRVKSIGHGMLHTKKPGEPRR